LLENAIATTARIRIGFGISIDIIHLLRKVSNLKKYNKYDIPVIIICSQGQRDIEVLAASI